jgi:GNAT superfamily N-acetyltransferase
LSDTHIRREAERIAKADPAHNFGLIAFAHSPESPPLPIGAARYASVDGAEYEAAISIRDDWQGLGVGSWLMELLVQAARQRQIHKLTGYIQHNNKAAWGMLAHLPHPVKRLSPVDGITPIEIWVNE